MERVDDQIFRIRQPVPRRAAEQEVAGEVDALDGQPGAPRHLHVDQRQRDRDPGAPIEHLVEEAVARILVVHLVADEAQLAEQIVVQRHHLRVAIGIDFRRRVRRRCRRVVDAAPRFLADRVELLEVRAGVECGYSTRAIISAATARSGSGLSAAEVKLRTSWGRITGGQDSKNAAVGARRARLKPSRYSKTTSRERLRVT